MWHILYMYMYSTNCWTHCHLVTVNCVISPPQPLDYETKRSYTLKVEATNRYIDPQFLTYGPFSDTTIVKLMVEDINEPPVFSTPLSKMVVSEAAKVGTTIGSVSARDPDDTDSAIR